MDADEARRRAEEFGFRTVFGNYNFVSTVKTLSSALTVYLGAGHIYSETLTQKKREILKSAPETIRLVHRYLSKAPLVRIDAAIGQDSAFTPGCTFYTSVYRKDAVRLAHKVAQTFFGPRPGARGELTVVLIPEWQEKERQILVFPEIGVTYVLGTDYYGEAKNAFLRMAMWQAKRRGMLGLHAGTKILRARGADGRLHKLGMIMFGIASTGKTTHSCHDHNLRGPGEGVEIVQDDVVFWCPDGSALGSERAFHVKTEGLSPAVQPLLYNASIRPDAILDNVVVDYQGNVYFEDRTLTANGHAIAQKAGLGDYASESVNLPHLEELDGLILAFMVRSYSAAPIAGKLTPEQAAVAFMLSESIDASGSDQPSAGMPGGIGANPLIIGDASEECNIFYELVKTHGDKLECYMLNTGGCGELVEHGLDGARKVRQKVTRVSIPEMASVIRGIARGTVRWSEDPNWMVETPKSVDGVEMAKFELGRHYSQDKSDSLIAAIRHERAEYAAQFSNLDPAILAAVEF